MAGTSWPALIAGARARASEVESKFDWIEGNIVPMSGGNATDAVYDLGTSATRWRDGYFSRNIIAGSRVIAGASAGGVGVVWAHNSTDVNLAIEGNIGFTTTAVSIRALNDNSSAYIPLELTALNTRITAGDFALVNGTAINEFSTDGTMAGNSNLAVPTEAAVRSYVTDLIGASNFGEAVIASTTALTDGTDITLQFTATMDIGGNFTSTGYVAPTNGTYEINFTFMSSLSLNATSGVAIFNLFFYRNTTTSQLANFTQSHVNPFPTHPNGNTAFCTWSGLFYQSLSVGDLVFCIVSTALSNSMTSATKQIVGGSGRQSRLRVRRFA